VIRERISLAQGNAVHKAVRINNLVATALRQAGQPARSVRQRAPRLRRWGSACTASLGKVAACRGSAHGGHIAATALEEYA
jgi:hypothetical protein